MRDKKAAKALARKSGQAGADYIALHYDDLDKQTKDDIRQSLIEEQGYICCYCMRRIHLGKGGMRIEHWRSQSRYETEQLDYGNLLASCDGQIETGKSHCDRSKGDLDITFNPSNPSIDIEASLKYLNDGTMESTDKRLMNDIDAVLNLNLPRLKQNRQAIVRSVEKRLDKGPGKRSRHYIEELLRAWESADDEGMFQPYSGVALYRIRKRLKRA